MKKLKHFSVMSIIFALIVGGIAGAYVSPIVVGSWETVYQDISTKVNDWSVTQNISSKVSQQTVKASESDLVFENFTDIPGELPEGWSSVKITTILPATILGIDFSPSVNPLGHDTDDGYTLAVFRDGTYRYSIAVPTIDAEIGQKVSELGLGIVALSVYDEDADKLVTDVYFYDPDRPLTITLARNYAGYKEPQLRCESNIASISGFKHIGTAYRSANLWGATNPIDSSITCESVNSIRLTNSLFGSSFNCERVTIKNPELSDDSNDAAIQEVLSIFDGYKESQANFDKRLDLYQEISEYFTDLSDYSEFDLEGYAKSLGAEVTTYYDSESMGIDGYREPSISEAREIFNIKKGDLSISIIYMFSFASIDEETVSISVNGKKPTSEDYKSVDDGARLRQAAGLSNTVTIGQKANISRTSFNYILDLLANS